MALILRSLALLLVATAPAAAALPSISDLQAAMDEQRLFISDAEELDRATSRVQNEMGLQLRDGDSACHFYQSGLARMAVLGKAWRDALQAARAQDARVQRMRMLPTVAPLVTDDLEADLDTLHARVDYATTSYQVATAWAEDVALRRLRRCEPALSAAAPPMADDAAAWVVGWTGTLCALDGGGGFRRISLDAPRAVRLDPPVACWSTTPCACTPEGVWSGMALGPEAPHEAP